MSIFIGGTGSANELDDYEEGTFTPTYGWSSSAQSGFTTVHRTLDAIQKLVV